VFAQFPEIDSVLIYGSRATGDFRNHSDIDLAVLAPSMTERDFSRLWNALDDLPILFKLDVVQFEQVTNPALKQNILAHGKTFYRPAAQTLTSSPDPNPRGPRP
jgi:proline iminopeptidase